MKYIRVLFLTSAMGPAAYAGGVLRPSLDENCNFQPYVGRPLLEERATFKTENEDFILVDKRGLRGFNRQLTEQIKGCYSEFANQELTRTCNFNVQNKKFSYGRGIVKIGGKVGAEYWGLGKELYDEVVAFAEKRYQGTLIEAIKSCSKTENFKVFNGAEFKYLWGILKAIKLSNPELISEGAFSEQRVNRGRDGSSTKYTLRIEDLSLTHDDDDEDKVEVSRDQTHVAPTQRGGRD